MTRRGEEKIDELGSTFRQAGLTLTVRRMLNTGSLPMMAAGRGLIKDRVAVRTRMRTTTQKRLKRHLKERVNQVETHPEQIYQAILDLVAQDPQLTAGGEILTRISGLSRITAFSMLIEMPKLGPLSRKQAACLAGLASISRPSGKWQGKERREGPHTGTRAAPSGQCAEWSSWLRHWSKQPVDDAQIRSGQSQGALA